jgi:hypothetical protein
MKKSPLLPLLLSLSLGAPCLKASPVEREAASILIRALGRETFEKISRDVAQKSASAALKTLGREGAEQAFKTGGIRLLEAGVLHGDDVWKVVQRVPEATRFVAARPEEALSLMRRFGDSAVHLESRLPGMTQKAVEHFGPHALPSLAKASTEEASRLLAYAGKAESREMKEALFKKWLKNGGLVLRTLDKHKKLILVSGLTWAMLDLADDVGEGIRNTPSATEDIASGAGEGLRTGMGILSASVGGSLLLAVWMRMRRRTS